MDNHPGLKLRLAYTSVTSHQATLVWSRPAQPVDHFELQWGDQQTVHLANSRYYCEMTKLTPATNYVATLTTFFFDGTKTQSSLSVVTPAAGKVIDVSEPPYCAIDSDMVQTANLQAAIDDCPAGGTVAIPEGLRVISGAIDLHSHMTLQVDGELIGSTDPFDYIVDQLKDRDQGINQDDLVWTRYEGWEMQCFRSLINVGHLNCQERSQVTCTDVKIVGHGVIRGGGNELGNAMESYFADTKCYPQYLSDNIPGRRVRGRLVNVIQTDGICLRDLKLQNPPCWTLHLIYSQHITVDSVQINSVGIDNGDGIDPDSCSHMLIFGASFDTGDDCIAIKSGKNPEGNQINIPTTDIEIFNLQMLRGHGMAVGTEESGGVQHVLVHDCIIHDTDFGIELKASNDRGGEVVDFNVDHCQIDSFFAHSVNYNADGEPATQLPVFTQLRITNTRITGNTHQQDVMGNSIDAFGKAIEVIGFQNEKETSLVAGLVVRNAILDHASDSCYFNHCQGVSLAGVSSRQGRLNLQIGPDVSQLQIN